MGIYDVNLIFIYLFMAHSEILGIKDLPEMLRFEGDRLGRQMRMIK